MRHITTALKTKYVDYIDDDIPIVLDFLFTNYGTVHTRVAKEKVHKVLTTLFVPSDPMVAIYRPIEQLGTLAKIAQIPYRVPSN